MVGGGIVVAVEIVERVESEFGEAERIEVGDDLLDPELIVGDALHDFVADGCGSVVAAGGVEVAGEDDGILDGAELIEERDHLFFAAGGRAFVFEMRGDDGDLARRGFGNGDVGDEGHAAAVAEFALDALFE